MGIWTWSEDFEQPNPDWFFTGGAGFDKGKGLAHTGQGNAWVRGSSGWNAINRFHKLPQIKPGYPMMFSAWLRLSPTLTDGYFSVRAANPEDLNGEGKILYDKKLPDPAQTKNADYNQYTFEADVGGLTTVLVYIGLWGVGQDAWIQVDDVVFQAQTPYP